MFGFFEKKFDPTRDLGDLQGRVVVVTGANGGIGYSTAKFLAFAGATVFLGARTEEKGRRAVESLTRELSELGGKDGNLRDGGQARPGTVEWFWCDIATPEKARRSAEGLLERVEGKEGRLDVLVNNAANHFGTFQFTQTLLPLLIKTSEEPGSDVRIVSLSSDVHRQGLGASSIINFKTLDEFKKMYENETVPWMARYGVSKLAVIMSSKALQRRLTASNSKIICITLHPGLVYTTNHLRFPFARVVGFIAWLFFKPQDEGAYNSCFAAASPVVRQEEEKYKGAYLMPVGRITDPARVALNEDVQDDLWETTERYLKDHA
ncbi:hypothetical protein CVT25_007099 [Psilocybe cyanescens]|uniref:NAD(P)-binding protein n=1 Tax=Psilocybe cyanescens TaxID=93625 RepID=A0A409XMV5_PSICY|nr:hypothetical protein CVT25_007099 [Psilocybe cyanescens]